MSTENQTVIPMISYEDGIAALEWLAKAFGFREVARICDPNGRLMHGELAVGDGLVMLASPTPDYHRAESHRLMRLIFSDLIKLSTRARHFF